MRNNFLLIIFICVVAAPFTLYAAPAAQPELPLPEDDVLIAPASARLSFAVDDVEPRLPSQYLAGRVPYNSYCQKVLASLIPPQKIGAVHRLIKSLLKLRQLLIGGVIGYQMPGWSLICVSASCRQSMNQFATVWPRKVAGSVMY